MLRFGICDDNAQARLTLRYDLEYLLQKRGISYQPLAFFSGERMLQWLKQHPGEMDVVFLDIEMPGMNGMETARKLRESDENIQIVFVTGYSEYVYEGYEVRALGYLLKPAKTKKLEEILIRTLEILQKEETQVYVCRNRDVTWRIPKKKILYFASDRRQVQCVTEEKTYTFYGKLDEVEMKM